VARLAFGDLSCPPAVEVEATSISIEFCSFIK